MFGLLGDLTRVEFSLRSRYNIITLTVADMCKYSPIGSKGLSRSIVIF